MNSNSKLIDYELQRDENFLEKLRKAKEEE